LTRAQRANHGIVLDGSKLNHLMSNDVRDEDLTRRGHHRHTDRTLQSAGRPRQLTHPGAVRGPQHHHASVTLVRHEEKGIIGGQGQAARIVKLAGLGAL
jgi:hypothetical protein